MNATLTTTQRKTLAAIASHSGDETLKPRGARGDTIQVLVRLGLVERKWHTVGRITTLRATEAGIAAASETEANR